MAKPRNNGASIRSAPVSMTTSNEYRNKVQDSCGENQGRSVQALAGAVLYQHPGGNDDRPEFGVAIVPGAREVRCHLAHLPAGHPVLELGLVVRRQLGCHIE